MPVSVFTVILGLSGFTIVLQKIPLLQTAAPLLSLVLLVFTVVLFLLFTILYLIRALRYPGSLQADFRHPVRISLIPAFSISLLLLSVAFIPLDPQVSRWLWYSGAALHLLLTLAVLSFWIQHPDLQIQHINPAWFIPAVGNMVVPLAGHLYSPEISWFFFSVGLVFWVILLGLLFNRIFFHHPLPDRLIPTLFILIAPPAVGFVSLVRLSGSVNDAARVLYYFSLFMTMLLFFQWKMFVRLRFSLSWWAYSFPLAALTIATLLMGQESGIVLYQILTWILLVLLVLLMALLLTLSLRAALRREICRPEE